eukprot:scaffold9405_cov111-Cylindrotheca_fusiformis.AAC.3
MFIRVRAFHDPRVSNHSKLWLYDPGWNSSFVDTEVKPAREPGKETPKKITALFSWVVDTPRNQSSLNHAAIMYVQQRFSVESFYAIRIIRTKRSTTTSEWTNYSSKLPDEMCSPRCIVA